MHLLREDNWWAPAFIKRAAAGLEGAQRAPEIERPAGEVAIDDVVVDTQPYRSGVSVDDDKNLVPFEELVRRLEQRGR